MNRFQEVLANYDWILKIIQSSITKFQCNACDNLVKQFETLYCSNAKDLDRKQMVTLLQQHLANQREVLNNILDDHEQTQDSVSVSQEG